MRLWLAILTLASFLGGCASPTRPQFSVPAGQYAKAFDEARDMLRSYRFSLERVDAADGVITTARKSTAGLATPWDSEQSSTRQEFQDFLNQQSRRVRITFRPATPSSAESVLNQPIDPAQELVGRVEVIIYRIETPGLRSPSKAITMTTLALDPLSPVAGQYEVAISQDSRFAARLAAELGKRLGPGAQLSSETAAPAARLARP